MVEEVLPVPLKILIAGVLNYLVAKKIMHGVEALNVANGFLSLDKGDIGQRCRSYQFGNCKTWNNLKKFLRTAYGTAEVGDVVRDPRSLFKICKGQDSLVRFSVRCFDARDFFEEIKCPAGIKGNNISVDDLEKLLQFTWMLNDVPDATVDSLMKDRKGV